jgi:hypothetical protein
MGPAARGRPALKGWTTAPRQWAASRKRLSMDITGKPAPDIAAFFGRQWPAVVLS